MFDALTQESSRKIEAILKDLLVLVEAEAVFVTDRGGNILAQQNVSSYEHEDNIAALASGAFFATLEMARMIGELQFRSLLHQGEKMSIYMESASGELLLLVIFSRESNPGLVKLYSRIACQQLEACKPGGSDEETAIKGALSNTRIEIDENAKLFELNTNQPQE